MKWKSYPGTAKTLKAVMLGFALLALIPRSHGQGLSFTNVSVESGNPGADNTVYRFPLVTNGVDALVKINGRSSAQVRLLSIDLTSAGFNKAFQPQVTYGQNNQAPTGNSDWWMEFQVTFVMTGTNTTVTVPTFSLTALDIDGNGDKIREYVGMYGLSTYSLEANTQLGFSSIMENINNVPTAVGTLFLGPVTNYANIDTGATKVMATANYLAKNSFRIRTGARSTGVSGAADRMYSLWFKSFVYQTPSELGLPVTLKGFNATLEQKKPKLSWTSLLEDNLSHYIVERSTNGQEFKDLIYVFATGTAKGEAKYNYTDAAVPVSKGVLYYRLKMVDADGKYKYSETRIIRLGDANLNIALQLYPNPAVNELRVTIPENWQGKTVQYTLFSTTGQVMKSFNRATASQTETVDLSNLPTGAYLIKAATSEESAIQRFVKAK